MVLLSNLIPNVANHPNDIYTFVIIIFIIPLTIGVTMSDMQMIGKVAHYFTKLGVAIIELSGELCTGDEICIQGPTTNFKQVVESMEIERAKVEKAGTGQSIGLKSMERVRQGDLVYKVVP